MTINGNALENLEIFMTQGSSVDNSSAKSIRRSIRGSLMDYLDHTCTPYGQRLLRKWVGMPLTDPIIIEDRLQSVQDLLDNYSVVQRFKVKASQSRWKQSHDIERMLSKVYSYSVKS